MTAPRPLTQDENQAAGAAFQGAPFNGARSQGSRPIYEGFPPGYVQANDS